MSSSEYVRRPLGSRAGLGTPYLRSHVRIRHGEMPVARPAACTEYLMRLILAFVQKFAKPLTDPHDLCHNHPCDQCTIQE